MLLTLRHLMEKYGITRNGLIVAIHSGRLKAKKQPGHTGLWLIKEEDYEEYKRSRFKRHETKVDGKLIFDKSKGFYSVHEAAEIIGCNFQRVYYHLRIGLIPSKRVRAAWVIHIDDINAYKTKLIQRKHKSADKRHHQFKRFK